MEVIKDQAYHYKDCGLDNVEIYGIPQYKCRSCDEIYVSIPKIKQLHKVLGMNLCCREEKLTGREIKFLRKELRLKAIEFAELLSVAPSTLSRYENDHEHPGETTEKLIRTIYLNMASSDADGAINVDWRQLLSKAAKLPANREKKIQINPGEWLEKLLPESCV
jgi:putative zinc finger/helix-turn-helix YgiT family protein